MSEYTISKAENGKSCTGKYLKKKRKENAPITDSPSSSEERGHTFLPYFIDTNFINNSSDV